MLYHYSFADRKRDLVSILTTIIKDEPRFISNFRRTADALDRRHEYFEDELFYRAISPYACVLQPDGLPQQYRLYVTNAEAEHIVLGTTLVLEGDALPFVVTGIDRHNSVIDIAAAKEEGFPITEMQMDPRQGGKFIIVSTPAAEGIDDDDENHVHVGIEWNAAQIFRKKIVLTGSILSTSLYGSVDNQLNRQTAFELSDLARDLNRVALFGRRVEAAEGVRGETGGLYYFACKKGCATLDAKQVTLPDGRKFKLDITHRMLTARELAAATGFPNDYVFCGGDTAAKKMIGNAVCPDLAEALILATLAA